MEYWKDELYHHGILGMRWGKRQGPPYPLGSSDHSAAEKKAGWRKSLGGGRNEESYAYKKKAAKQRRKDRRDIKEAKRGQSATPRSRIRDKIDAQIRKGDRLAEERSYLGIFGVGFKDVLVTQLLGAAAATGANALGMQHVGNVIVAGTNIATLGIEVRTGYSFVKKYLDS